MRYPADQKARTRRKILDAAGRVFRRQGYNGSGVDAVMKEAGLTHGGFYSHFRNKEALFAETVMEALRSMRDRHSEWTDGLDGKDWLRAFGQGYLSPEHMAGAEQGCPAPPLVSELGRAGEAPKRSFEQGLMGWAADIASHLPTSEAEPASDEGEGPDLDAALGIIAACVGGVALARAVDDPALAERVLRSARALFVAPHSDSEAEASA
jgi:AcrR family transcriptional regulator